MFRLELSPRIHLLSIREIYYVSLHVLQDSSAVAMPPPGTEATTQPKEGLEQSPDSPGTNVTPGGETTAVEDTNGGATNSELAAATPTKTVLTGSDGQVDIILSQTAENSHTVDEPTLTETMADEKMNPEAIADETTPKEAMVTEAAPSDAMVTESTLSESMVTETTPSEAMVTETTPSETMVTKAVPNETMVIVTTPNKTMPNETMVIEALPSETMAVKCKEEETAPIQALKDEPMPTVVTDTVMSEPSELMSSPVQAPTMDAVPGTEATPTTTD